ncbi:MAG: DUF2155 domain-containing protein [Rhodobacter sp.]|nr:DUF2155 domain-containing protein [Paracoccaceae bacterium]MCC0078676.1 DUF2155 domain-containing protein [Rhodobacter sp.]
MSGGRLKPAAVAAALGLALAGPVAAQQVNWQVLGEALHDQRPTGPEMASGTEAVLRGLDKISGEVEDMTLAVGGTVTYHHLTVALTGCRYPADNPSSDAYAFLDITDANDGERLFHGWMVASSPALNALDHPRYDIWVLGCH